VTNDLIDRLRELTAALTVWLEELPTAERLDALAALHAAHRELQRLVVTARGAALAELIDEQGIDVVSRALGVTADQLLELIDRKLPD
jgi:hypothetical protein